jgi:hypothetical protein
MVIVDNLKKAFKIESLKNLLRRYYLFKVKWDLNTFETLPSMYSTLNQ